MDEFDLSDGSSEGSVKFDLQADNQNDVVDKFASIEQAGTTIPDGKRNKGMQESMYAHAVSKPGFKGKGKAVVTKPALANDKIRQNNFSSITNVRGDNGTAESN